MTDLDPQTGATAEALLRELKDGRTVYVEGPLGSGRSALVQQLRSMPGVCVLDLLPFEEVDCAATALLEARATLSEADIRPTETGAEDEYFERALSVAQAAADTGQLVVRLPTSWGTVAERSNRDHAWLRNARAWFSGLLKAAVPFAVIADAAITPRELGIHAQTRLPALPQHLVRVDALEPIEWGAYRAAYKQLSTHAGNDPAPPVAWRLAVGAVRFGMAPGDAVRMSRQVTSIALLARALADKMRTRPELVTPTRRFAAVRRPIAREALLGIVDPPEGHATLYTECLAYGDTVSRISTPLRELLRRRFGQSDDAGHAHLAEHYKTLDGAFVAPLSDPDAARAWSEKIHHLAAGGEQTQAEWARQQLVSPEQYWSRARPLSWKGQYAQAADIYRACTQQFPDDDYAWHYLAWNLQRSRRSRAEAEAAFKRAVELDPENPWWNSRLVTFYIATGRPATARDEWRQAVERTDPDGEKVASDPWLAEHMHRWIARDWLRAGRPAWAADVINTIPERVLRRCRRSFRDISKKALRKDEPKRWAAFLEGLEAKFDKLPVGTGEATRTAWRELREELGRELPLPVAGPTADGERLQFCWRYQTLLVEIEVQADGRVEWFAKDDTGRSGGSVEAEPLLSPALTEWLQRVALGR